MTTTSRDRAALEQHLPRRPGHALLLGEITDVERSLRGRGWQVTRGNADRDFGVAPGSCDLVVMRDVISRQPWERWQLQRIHHVLRPGGLLALDEPQRHDLSTPGGIAYVGGRAGRELRHRLERAAGRRPDLTRPAIGRRPAPAALRETLEALRFEILSLALERRGGWSSLLPRRFAPRLTVVARAPGDAAGPDRPFDPQAHRARYERAQPALLETRRRWTAAHPEWVTAPPAPFDPAAFAGRTVLVLSPHPDDEVIGAGGAILKLVRAGARVACIQATDGSASAALAGRPEDERQRRRLDEAAVVAQAMGGVELECWKADNRAFRVDPALVARLVGRLERDRPALILAPFVTEAHEDHLTLARILSRALRALPSPLDATILGYEVWSLVPPALVHDISPLMDELARLLFLYETAMKVDDFVHFCADRALYHGITVRGTACHLEAFHAVAARDYPALLRSVISGDDV